MENSPRRHWGCSAGRRSALPPSPGVLTGIVVGARGVARLRRQQTAPGLELLPWRRGDFRNPCHYTASVPIMTRRSLVRDAAASGTLVLVADSEKEARAAVEQFN